MNSNNYSNNKEDDIVLVDIESNSDKIKNNINTKENKKISINNANLLMNCLKTNNYCFSLMDYFKKMFKFSQIDFYSSYLQIWYCFTPKKLNDMAKIRKQLKNQWARDDPGFILIILIVILFFNLLYSMVMQNFNIYHTIQLFCFQAFFCFIIFGIFIGFILKYFIEKYLRNEEASFSKGQSVESIYAFDIHCNAFVPFYFFTNILQFFCLPIILNEGYLATIISNVLYTVGILYYFYVTLLCYYCIPFIKKNKYIPLTIWPIIGTFVILTLFNFNTSKFILNTVYNFTNNQNEIISGDKIGSALEIN